MLGSFNVCAQYQGLEDWFGSLPEWQPMVNEAIKCLLSDWEGVLWNAGSAVNDQDWLMRIFCCQASGKKYQWKWILWLLLQVTAKGHPKRTNMTNQSSKNENEAARVTSQSSSWNTLAGDNVRQNVHDRYPTRVQTPFTTDQVGDTCWEYWGKTDHSQVYQI